MLLPNTRLILLLSSNNSRPVTRPFTTSYMMLLRCFAHSLLAKTDHLLSAYPLLNHRLFTCLLCRVLIIVSLARMAAIRDRDEGCNGWHLRDERQLRDGDEFPDAHREDMLL